MLPPLGFILRGIDREMWDDFKAYCAGRGQSMRYVILDLIQRLVDGEIELKPPPAPPRKSKRTRVKKDKS